MTVVDLVEVADLARVEVTQLEVAHVRHVKRVEDAAAVRQQSVEVEGVGRSPPLLSVTSSSLSMTSRKLRRSSIARREARWTMR